MSRQKKTLLASAVLVAAAIVVSASAIYWMGQIAPLGVALEQIEVSDISVAKGVFSGNYSILLSLRNTGNVDTLVDMVKINGLPYYDESFIDKISVREYDGPWVTSGALSILVRAGSSESIIMRIKPTSGSETIMPLTDGAKLNIEIHTAEGIDYPKTVILTSSG